MAAQNATRLSKHVIDLTGQTFGKWTVIRLAGFNKHKNATWLCVCECGREKIVTGTALNCGHSGQCSSCARRRHGMRNTPEYHAWVNLLQRCYNPNAQQFSNYGARGITVCDRWQDSFEAFYEDMGPRPSPRHSLDRHPDPNGPYAPDNCRWATSGEQSRNRRTNRLLTFDGKAMCLAEWAEQYHMRRDTLRRRLLRGWDMERALTTPVS